MQQNIHEQRISAVSLTLHAWLLQCIHVCLDVGTCIWEWLCFCVCVCLSKRSILCHGKHAHSPFPSPHQLHVGKLLCQCVRVIADGEHVLLDRRRLGFEGHQLVRDGGGVEGDLDNALFPLAHQGQPLAKLLQHLVQGFPVRLRRGEERRVGRL